MSWHKRMLSLAEHIAEWSKDPSTRVGCVLVDRKRRVIGMGYNGFPRGVSDASERYDDRDAKYLMVQHAEANAILNATAKTEGCIAYVTHYPCANCSGLLIQAGVSTIITRSPDAGLLSRFEASFAASQLMFGEAGINLILMDDDA